MVLELISHNSNEINFKILSNLSITINQIYFFKNYKILNTKISEYDLRGECLFKIPLYY